MENDNDNTQSFVPLVKGTEVGHYKIIEKIGAGGMGEVYLAEDTKLNREVAIKFLPAHLSGDQDYRARFVREARAVAALSHPNIVTIHEVGEFKNRPFFAMECVKGESLRDIIKKDKLPVEEAINYTGQICEGLQEAHEAGIVHRDIKPANIIIDSKGRARLLDFGLAMVASEEKLTKTGSTLGTVGYMSPEQIEGKKVDQRSDIFSVGVILYEMVTGRRPFEGDNDAAVVKAITSSSPEPIARFKSGVTGELQRIIDKALVKDASLRYQHADGMLADLKRLQTGAAPTKKSRPALWAAFAAIVIAVFGYFFIDHFLLQKKAAKDGWTDSIAVLIFRDLSPEQDQDYFCEGMTDAIIGRLSTIKNLKVTSLTSVLPFKSAEHNLKIIGKELKVSTILEGTIQKVKDSIRVRAQLINVKDDAHLWSDYYDREVTSIFAVQDDISRAIVEVMKIQLAGNEEDALVKRGTDNLEAYNAYMRGRYFWRKRIEKDMLKAIEYFNKAIELDPDYALAYAGISDVWVALPDYSNYSQIEVRPKAMEAVSKALELDDNLCEAYASLGLIYTRNLELEKAEKAFQRALEINPNYSWTYVWYANLFTGYFNDDNKGIKYLELALELDPLSSVALHNLALVKRDFKEYDTAGVLHRKSLEIEPNNIIFLGQYAFHFTWVEQGDSALHYAERTIELEPDNWRSRNYYGGILAYFRRDDEAIEQYQLACELSPNNYLPYDAFGGFYYRHRQDYEKAIPLYLKAIEFNPRSYASYNRLAYCYAGVGEYEAAIDAVTRAIELVPFQTYYIDTRADIHMTFGHFDKAIADYRLFLDKEPNSPFIDDVLNDFVRACTFGRQYTRADSLYKVLLERADSTTRPVARRRLTMPSRHQGKFRQTVKMLKEWMAIEGQKQGDKWQSVYTLYDMACINMYFLNDIDSAIAQFTRAREMVRRLDSTHNWNVITQGRIAEALAIAGEKTKARNTLKNCRATMDTTKSGSVNTFKFYNALMEYNLGNYDSAVAHIEKRNNAVFTGKVTAGFMHLAAGQIEKAVSYLEDAMSKYDDNRLYYPERSVMGHYYLAKAYEAAGRMSDAIEQYETFLDIWKNADEGLKPANDAKERLTRLKNKS